jgi:hypothetical protein
MKTAEVKTTGINNNKVENKTADNKAENGIGNNNEPQKFNNLPVSTAFNNEAKKDEAKKAETPAPAQPKEQPKGTAPTEQPKPQDEKPQVEPTKKEVKETVKPVFNLESTLKLVEELHRKKIQRQRLMETIDTLEAFEVAQIDEADETESNHFQGCVLTIEDDNRKKFTTKNPVIIQAVAQFVNRMCVDRLAEIEAGITIPA